MSDVLEGRQFFLAKALVGFALPEEEVQCRLEHRDDRRADQDRSRAERILRHVEDARDRRVAYLMGESNPGLVTRLRTPWPWSSLNILPWHHLLTLWALTFTTLGRTLHETCRGEPFSL